MHKEEEHLAASRILAVTEEELKRIILDLHDGPVQQLFAAQAQLHSLQSRQKKFYIEFLTSNLCQSA